MKVIAIDAMGGDNAPDATIKGAVRAINQIDAEILLIGDKDIINSKVKEFYKNSLAHEYVSFMEEDMGDLFHFSIEKNY